MDFWSGLFGFLGGFVDEAWDSESDKRRDATDKELKERQQELDQKIKEQQLSFQRDIAMGVGAVAIVGVIGWVIVARSK